MIRNDAGNTAHSLCCLIAFCRLLARGKEQKVHSVIWPQINYSSACINVTDGCFNTKSLVLTLVLSEKSFVLAGSDILEYEHRQLPTSHRSSPSVCRIALDPNLFLCGELHLNVRTFCGLRRDGMLCTRSFCWLRKCCNDDDDYDDDDRRVLRIQ